ncbi:MAG: alpha/beta hydrolase [Robiginitomaculum sp.]|nr:MAG: alpha/beta hydrolase [Robiginitomaculum sp.]
MNIAAISSRVSVALLLSIWLGGCVQTTLAWAKLDPKGDAARPKLSLSASQDNAAIFAEYRQDFQDFVYGRMPDYSNTKVLSKKVLNEDALSGQARLEEWRLEIEAGFGDDVSLRASNRGQFNLVVLMPNAVQGPVPVIMMQTFCPSNVTIPLAGVSTLGTSGGCDGDGFMSKTIGYVFGRYIATPPLQDILDHGFAIAAMFPSEVFPDSSKSGPAELKRMSSGHDDDETRWGTVGAWAWMFSRVEDALAADGRFDPDRTITYGHSRYGKSALVAAAFDPRIDGVIAHQSGTGGASLSRGNLGETVAKITGSYPHWFSRKYASFAEVTDNIPVDQHQLLALIAPRPVLLGNARRDVWSDPNGAFRAAQAASSAWQAYGISGLQQDRLVPFHPEANLAFWMRPGTHGVVEEDWPAFLSFLDAHFAPDAAE